MLGAASLGAGSMYAVGKYLPRYNNNKAAKVLADEKLNLTKTVHPEIDEFLNKARSAAKKAGYPKSFSKKNAKSDYLSNFQNEMKKVDLTTFTNKNFDEFPLPGQAIGTFKQNQETVSNMQKAYSKGVKGADSAGKKAIIERLKQDTYLPTIKKLTHEFNKTKDPKILELKNRHIKNMNNMVNNI